MNTHITFNEDKLNTFVEVVRGATLVTSPSVRQNILELYLNETEEYIRDEFGSGDDFEDILSSFRDQIVETCYQKYKNK